MITSELEFEAFEQQMHQCLAHYYDYAFLHDQPLIRTLVPNAPGDAGRVQRFREMIENAIESLKHGAENDASSKPARIYNILFYRYVNQEPVHRVLYRLSLGERQYYRDHNKAIQILSRILFEQLKERHPAPDSPHHSISIQSEIQRLHKVTRLEQVDVGGFLQKTLSAIQSLCEHYHATITLRVSGQCLLLQNDSAVLRQAIIWLLSQLIIQSGTNHQFTLSFVAHEEAGQFTITRETPAQQANLSQPFLDQQETLHNLVEALESRIDEEVLPEGGYRVCLTVPQRKHSILIIDDNPDVVTLFRRYLAGYPYLVLTTDEADSALELARDSSPELIILDVLLPQRDGWEILQSLKRHPLTQHIPVLVCSVLDSPELARVLGADGFLRKPPGETEFLGVLAHLSYQSTPH